MIVGPCFPDDDMDVAWQQHDVYKKALSIIVNYVNLFGRAARHVLCDEEHETWGAVKQVDHRTVQSSHDILAASWRYKNTWNNPEFGFHLKQSATLEDAWLYWLKNEVKSWINCPKIIRLFLIILSNQNEQVGYAAETKLGLTLFERHGSDTWYPQIRDALRKDAIKYGSEILRDPTGISQKPMCPYNTYTFTKSGPGGTV
jgi:hypothetical protein